MKMLLFFFLLASNHNVLCMDSDDSSFAITVIQSSSESDSSNDIIPSDVESGLAEPIGEWRDTNKDDAIKLYQWVIKELLEKENSEHEQQLTQRRYKWIAGTVGFITTMVPLAVAIIQATTTK